MLERYQTKLNAAAALREEKPESSLWIDWRTGTISMSERPGFSVLIHTSADRRAAIINRLKEKKITVIP